MVLNRIQDSTMTWILAEKKMLALLATQFPANVHAGRKQVMA